MKKNIILATLLLVSMVTAAEKPLLRAGLTTDTHVTPNPRSVTKLRAALNLFKQQKT